MQESDLATLSQKVLAAAFALSALFGAVAQRTHFCTMGALSDAYNLRDFNRLRQWGLAVGIAAFGYAALVAWGGLDPARTLYATDRVLWLSALVGGAMFGFGMVLASGCGSKTLVRVGAGSLKALVVMVVMGVAAYATLRGVTAVARVATVDRISFVPAGGTSLSGQLQSLGLSAGSAALSAALVVGTALMVWALAARDFRTRDNLLAGTGVGLAVAGMWWASGWLGHVAEHPLTLEDVYITTNSGRAEAMTFTAPMGYLLDWLMFFSDKNKVLTFGVVSVLGTVAGAAAMALASGRFQWEGFASTEDLANHLVGAVLMGVGGVTAMGCTVGQGLSGLSTLSFNSMLAVAGIAAGAIAAFRYQIWRLERAG